MARTCAWAREVSEGGDGGGWGGGDAYEGEGDDGFEAGGHVWGAVGL